MNSQTLSTILEPYLQDGTFSLPSTAVSSPIYEQLAQQLFDDGQLTLGQATLAVGEDDTVTVSGRMPFLQRTDIATAVAFAPADDDQIKVSLALSFADGNGVDLLSVVSRFLPSADALPTLTLATLAIETDPSASRYALSATTAELWSIDIGCSGLAVKDIQLDLERVGENGTATTTGAIAGTLAIGQSDFTVSYAFPGDPVITAAISTFNLANIIDGLCGDDVFDGVSLPTGFIDVDLTDIAIAIDLAEQIFSLAATSPLGTAEMVVGKIGNEWEFGIGFALPANWKLSKIDKVLSVLDDLDMSGTRLLLTTMGDGSIALPTLEIPDGNMIAGLNFYTDLNMASLGVKSLLGIDSLVVQAAVSKNPSDILLAAHIEGEFNLGSGVTFGDIVFRLKPDPADFSVALLGTVTTTINGDPLAFVGSMAVEMRAATFAATMFGTWNEPFGVKKVAISNVALELGVSFPPPLPSIGVAGELQVGSFYGAMAVKFDSATPSQSMLAVAFNRLYLEDVVKTFCAGKVYRSIPSNWWDTFLNVGYTDVELYIALQDTQIGELVYEQGFRFAGNMTLWGLDGYGRLEISYTDGITAEAQMDPINLANALVITGAQGDKKPQLSMTLPPDPADLKLYISCAVTLLQLKKELLIDISDAGMTFYLEEKYGKNLHTKLSCTLKNGRFDASGSLNFKLNCTVGPIKIEGVKVADKIRLVDVAFNAATTMKVTTSPSFFLKMSGDFSFYGEKLAFPTLKIEATPDDFDAVYKAVTKQIEDAADDIFDPLFSSASKWVTAVGEDFIDFSGDAAQVLHDGFNQSAKEAAKLMKQMGKGVNDIAKGMKSAYGYTSEGVTTLLKSVGYSADQIGGALKSVYNTTAQNAAKHLKKAGYTAQQVGNVLKNTYKQSAQNAAKLLKGAGYAADQVGTALKNTFNTSAETATKYLKAAGYSANQIGSALKNVYRTSSQNAAKYLKAAGYGAEEIAKTLSSAFSLSANDISKVMKGIGFDMDDIGKALKSVGNFSENAINDALKAAGFSSKSIKKFMSKTFGGSWTKALNPKNWF